MELKSLPSLKELGIVGMELERIYPKAMPIDKEGYLHIVREFEIAAKTIPPEYLELMQFFSPKALQTEQFFRIVNGRYRHGTLDSVVNAIMGNSSIFQASVARAMQTERLSLPHGIYVAVEQTHLKEWKSNDPAHPSIKSGLAQGDIMHTSLLYDAALHYTRSLVRLEHLMQKTPGLAVPR